MNHPAPKTDKEYMTHGDCPICPAKHGQWCMIRIRRTVTEWLLRRNKHNAWKEGGAFVHRARIERTINDYPNWKD